MNVKRFLLGLGCWCGFDCYRSTVIILLLLYVYNAMVSSNKNVFYVLKLKDGDYKYKLKSYPQIIKKTKCLLCS